MFLKMWKSILFRFQNKMTRCILCSPSALSCTQWELMKVFILTSEKNTKKRWTKCLKGKDIGCLFSGWIQPENRKRGGFSIFRLKVFSIDDVSKWDSKLIQRLFDDLFRYFSHLIIFSWKIYLFVYGFDASLWIYGYS